MEHFEHRYEREWPPDHPARTRYTAFVPPSVPFPSKRELDAHAAELRLPYIDPNENSIHWRHWRACWPWIRQDDTKRWVRKSWPHPVSLDITEWIDVMERHAAGRCTDARCDRVWAAIDEAGGGIAGRTAFFRALVREARRELPASAWSEYRAKIDLLADLRASRADFERLAGENDALIAETGGEHAPSRRAAAQRGNAIRRHWATECTQAQVENQTPRWNSDRRPIEPPPALRPSLADLATLDHTRAAAAQAAARDLVRLVETGNARFANADTEARIRRHAAGTFESPVVVPPAQPSGLLPVAESESAGED
jgi:hypothetical protein